MILGAHISVAGGLDLAPAPGAAIGCEAIQIFSRLNDSRKPLGSHVDNHAAIGKGHIGLKPFGFWMNDKTWAKTPAVLETPGGEKNYQRELKLLRKL